MYRNPPQHNVRAVPMGNGVIPETARPRRPAGHDDWALAITLLMFGGIGWLAGAFFTLHGWVVGLNMFFGWTTFPITIPAPAGWWILAMVPIGVVYSRVEMQVWRRKQRDWRAMAQFIIGWLLIISTDVGTTYLGVRQPGATLPILVWVASSAVVSLIWSVVLTFASDWLIIGAWKLLRR